MAEQRSAFVIHVSSVDVIVDKARPLSGLVSCLYGERERSLLERFINFLRELYISPSDTAANLILIFSKYNNGQCSDQDGRFGNVQ